MILPDLERQAYHEAGHAVLDYFASSLLRHLMIDIGAFRYSIGHPRYHEDGYRRFHYVNDFDSLMGGAQAELIKFGGIYLSCIGEDIKIETVVHREFMSPVWELAFECTPWMATIIESQMHKDSWEKAGRTLRLHWYLVEAVANRLLHKKSLAGHLIPKIMYAASRVRPKPDPTNLL